MLDLPLSESQANIEEEFSAGEGIYFWCFQSGIMSLLVVFVVVSKTVPRYG